MRWLGSPSTPVLQYSVDSVSMRWISLRTAALDGPYMRRTGCIRPPLFHVEDGGSAFPRSEVGSTNIGAAPSTVGSTTAEAPLERRAAAEAQPSHRRRRKFGAVETLCCPPRALTLPSDAAAVRLLILVMVDGIRKADGIRKERFPSSRQRSMTVFVRAATSNDCKRRPSGGAVAKTKASFGFL
mmetsp:Transcript_29917/g.88950  ORF Transcript_29917/g.88950 Transcript_29917/m.88950 type:complete len:184 (+) Transcript_29917:2479-3030(+)